MLGYFIKDVAKMTRVKLDSVDELVRNLLIIDSSHRYSVEKALFKMFRKILPMSCCGNIAGFIFSSN